MYFDCYLRWEGIDVKPSLEPKYRLCSNIEEKKERSLFSYDYWFVRHVCRAC